MSDNRYISAWMEERGIVLASGFAENLRGLAQAYKKMRRQCDGDLRSDRMF